MILVLSNNIDKESKEVVKWLKLLKKEYVLENNIYNLYTNNYNGQLESIWFRKLEIPEFSLGDKMFSTDERLLNQFLLDEVLHSLSYIDNKFKVIKNVGNVLSMDLNKYQILLEAESIGMSIPETLITTCKAELFVFLKKNKIIITKPLSNIVSFKDKKQAKLIVPYTASITSADLSQIPSFFYPTLLQKCIDISYEIKSIFFNDNIYSMSIHSNMFNSEIDLKKVIRNDKRVKMLPCKLPNHLQKKVQKLFKKLKLNIGTFDIVVDRNNDYHFLEINPSGQFNRIVEVTNCDVYKRIAEYL